MTHGQTERRHFHVDARELLLDRPEACLFVPDLRLLGLAITPAGQHHVIFVLGCDVLDRFYLGPDDATVARRSKILIDALQHGTRALDDARAALVDLWISAAWDTTLDELAEAIAAKDLTHL